MAVKKEEGDQHVAHVTFKIPDFWPHDPTTWFRKMGEQIQDLQHNPVIHEI